MHWKTLAIIGSLAVLAGCATSRTVYVDYATATKRLVSASPLGDEHYTAEGEIIAPAADGIERWSEGWRVYRRWFERDGEVLLKISEREASAKLGRWKTEVTVRKNGNATSLRVLTDSLHYSILKPTDRDLKREREWCDEIERILLGEGSNRIPPPN